MFDFKKKVTVVVLLLVIVFLAFGLFATKSNAVSLGGGMLLGKFLTCCAFGVLQNLAALISPCLLFRYWPSHGLAAGFTEENGLWIMSYGYRDQVAV